MFTIKLYREDRQRILECESFTILRDDSKREYEITLHGVVGFDSPDKRYDVTGSAELNTYVESFHRAIIENSKGQTTEILDAGSIPRRA